MADANRSDWVSIPVTPRQTLRLGPDGQSYVFEEPPGEIRIRCTPARASTVAFRFPERPAGDDPAGSG